MNVSLPKLSRAEWIVFLLLVTGLLSWYLGMEWGLREATKVSTVESAEIEQAVARLKLTATIQSISSTVLIVTYLLLLAMARRFRNTPIMLKWFLIIPAGYYIILFLRISSDGHLLRYLLLLLAVVLVLPNRWIARTRFAVMTYSLATHVMAAAFIAYTLHSVRTMSHEAFVTSFLFISAMYLVLISACTVSAWTAYLFRTENTRAMSGLTIYRWICIVLIAVVCSSSLVVSRKAKTVERDRQEQFDEKIRQLESLQHEIENMNDELLIRE